MLISLLYTLVTLFIFVYGFTVGKTKSSMMDQQNHETKNDKQDPEQQQNEPTGVRLEEEIRNIIRRNINIQMEKEQQNPNDVVENVAQDSKPQIGVNIRRIVDGASQDIWFLLQQLRELRHQPEVDLEKLIRLRDRLHQRVQQIVDRAIEKYFPEMRQLRPEEFNNQCIRLMNFYARLKDQLQEQVPQEKVEVQVELKEHKFIVVRFLWK